MEELKLKLLPFIVGPKESIREAIKKMDHAGEGILLVVDQGCLKGIITDGDFRRAILKGFSLDREVQVIMNPDFVSVKPNATQEEIINAFQKNRIRHLPVCEDDLVKDLIIEEKYLLENKKKRKKLPVLNCPVVIMAGGKGTRLDPFTRILPKPLIPIDDKPIIEIIMDNFNKYGIQTFHLSINYKAQLLKAYFAERNLKYKINFVEESRPLGTAGSLVLLKKELNYPFIVSNCDVLLNIDFADLVGFHEKNKCDITIVGVMQHHVFPYGVCEISEEGLLEAIKEKPHFDFIINSGMYVINPESLKFITKDKFYNMTEFIGDVKAEGGRVGLFPVSSKAWHDTGEWDKYGQALRSLTLPEKRSF